MKTLPKKTYQVWAMESGDTDTVTQFNTPLTARILYLHKTKIAYDREEVQCMEQQCNGAIKLSSGH